MGTLENYTAPPWLEVGKDYSQYMPKFRQELKALDLCKYKRGSVTLIEDCVYVQVIDRARVEWCIRVNLMWVGEVSISDAIRAFNIGKRDSSDYIKIDEEDGQTSVFYAKSKIPVEVV
jgi:hypothetical protein